MFLGKQVRHGRNSAFVMNFELAHRKLILLDIDGTLLLSRGSALRAMNMAGQHVFGPALKFDEVDRLGRLDPHILDAALNHHEIDATEEQREQFRRRYFSALRDEIHIAHALPGAVELVRRLAGVDRLVLGLVTGNYREAARIKLDAVDIGMEPFTANGFGEEAPDRAGLVRLAIERAERRMQAMKDNYQHARAQAALARAMARISCREAAQTAGTCQQ